MDRGMETMVRNIDWGFFQLRYKCSAVMRGVDTTHGGRG